MRVLLIDDESEDMDWMAEFLESGGHHLDTSWNLLDGERRLGLVTPTNEAPAGAYDLLILDIAMAIAPLEELPDWGPETRDASLNAGLTLLKALKCHPSLATLPALVYTARPETEESARALGAEWVFRDGTPKFRATLERMLAALRPSR